MGLESAVFATWLDERRLLRLLFFNTFISFRKGCAPSHGTTLSGVVCVAVACASEKHSDLSRRLPVSGRHPESLV